MARRGIGSSGALGRAGALGKVEGEEEGVIDLTDIPDCRTVFVDALNRTVVVKALASSEVLGSTRLVSVAAHPAMEVFGIDRTAEVHC